MRWPSSPPPRPHLRRHQQRALRHAVATQVGHSNRRGTRPAQPRRARPVATGINRRSSAQWRRAGPPLLATQVWSKPLPRSGGPRPSISRSGRPRTCRRSHARRLDGTTLTEMQYLRHLVEPGGRHRYGERPSAHEDMSSRARAWSTIDHELDVIEHLGFAGYFLVVWDLVEFCNRADIFCQGRGSAANSAVVLRARHHQGRCRVARLCCSNGSCRPSATAPPTSTSTSKATGARKSSSTCTNATAGITPRRWPTSSPIGRGRRYATWPRRSAMHPASRMRGASRSTHGAMSRRRPTSRITASRQPCSSLATEIEDAPRHLGIHSGGMVICDRPVIEVCPVEWGRMDKRSVLQWDKDDCAAAGLVKFDLFGLGMLSALALRGRSHPRAPWLRSRSGNHPARRRRVLDVVPRRHGGCVPDRITCPDGHAAAVEAAPLLRPCGRGCADPSWSHSGRIGASRTSAAATVRSPSPTCIRCSRTHSEKRWVCRCSKNN